VEHRPHSHIAKREGYHDFRVRVHDALGVWEALEYLAVDEALGVALGCVGVDGRGGGNVVGDEVAAGFYERWGAWVVGGDYAV